MACGSARVLLEHGGQQRGPRDATIKRPQDAAQRLAPEPCPAALIGNGRTPAADTMAPPLQFRPADGSGSDHEHAAIASAMRADASRARVRRDRGLAEGMLIALRFGERGGLARSRQSKARDNPGHVIRRQARLAQALGRGSEHRRKALLQPETNIGRTGNRLRRAALPTWLEGEPDRAWHRRRRQGGVSGRSRPSAHVRVILPKSAHLKTPRERIAVTGIVIENTAPGTLMIIK